MDVNEKLYGTSELPVVWRTLRAGLLSADLENGQLRYVRYGGRELIRATAMPSHLTTAEDP